MKIVRDIVAEFVRISSGCCNSVERNSHEFRYLES